MTDHPYGDPAQAPNLDNVGQTPTPASSWRGKQSSGNHPVEVPSGNVALCRRPGIQVFMQVGIIPNSLMSVISSMIGKAQNGQDVGPVEVDQAMEKLLDDPTKLKDIFELVDAVTCFICVQPEVKRAPAEGEARDPDALYVDEVVLEDKMFLFQWAVGGTESLESFRAGLGQGVDALSAQQNVADATQQSS
jgi:hypothetical protein